MSDNQNTPRTRREATCKLGILLYSISAGRVFRISRLCASLTCPGCAPGARTKRVGLAREVLEGMEIHLAHVPANAWERTYKRIQRAGGRYVWIQHRDGSRDVWATVDPGHDQRAGFAWIETSVHLCLQRIEELLRLTDVVKLTRPFGTSEREQKTNSRDLVKIGIVRQGEELKLDTRVRELCRMLHEVESPDWLTGQQNLDLHERALREVTGRPTSRREVPGISMKSDNGGTAQP